MAQRSVMVKDSALGLMMVKRLALAMVWTLD
jgi:hypothetical protein